MLRVDLSFAWFAWFAWLQLAQCVRSNQEVRAAPGLFVSDLAAFWLASDRKMFQKG